MKNEIDSIMRGLLTYISSCKDSICSHIANINPRLWIQLLFLIQRAHQVTAIGWRYLNHLNILISDIWTNDLRGEIARRLLTSENNSWPMTPPSIMAARSIVSSPELGTPDRCWYETVLREPKAENLSISREWNWYARFNK